MNTLRYLFVHVSICCAALALSACGPARVDDLPRQAVSGKVTLDGRPLGRGTILFQPTSGLPTPAMVSITGGSYSIPTAHGLVPGSYKVSISSSENSGPAEKFGEAPGKTPPLPKELIPPQYSTATTLTAEVKEGASNSFDFDLTSAATPKK
jgi:hypothetical protein